MPGVTVVLGDTAADARERAAEIRHRQVSPQNALLALERIWGVDLSSYDPDGPLPDIDPEPEPALAQGGCASPTPRGGGEVAGPVAGEGAVHPADRDRGVRAAVLRRHAGDGRRRTRRVRDGRRRRRLHPRPHLTPGGLDEFVDRVVPLLQERGAFRTEYTGTTLRSHLGLPEPVWKG